MGHHTIHTANRKTYHFTLHADPLLSASLQVDHEKRTRLGYPNTGCCAFSSLIKKYTDIYNVYITSNCN